jgi:4-alpha-glucanotransferase
MEMLGILGLEIQRMPKDDSMEFSNPQNAGYLTVLSTSTHDMSTIRGWWEENPEVTQRFYNTQLGMEGKAPEVCTQEIARNMIDLLLETRAMWVIFPVQDLFAMSDQLKNPDIQAERINIPGISNHYWRYRMHLSLDDLENLDDFRDLIRNMLRSSGRGVQPGW